MQIEVDAMILYIFPMNTEDDGLAKRQGGLERNPAEEPFLARRHCVVDIWGQEDGFPLDGWTEVLGDGREEKLQDALLARVERRFFRPCLCKSFAIADEIESIMAP